MTEVLALILMGAALGAVLFIHEIEKRGWRAERADLLNRLMVKNWTEYQAMTQQPTEDNTPQLTTEEAEAAWYAAQQRQYEKAAGR